MLTVWHNHLKDPKDKDQFRRLVLGSKKVLDRAKEIVYNMSIVESKTTLTDFESPSWPYRRAYIDGRKAAMDEIIKLLTVED